MIVAVLKEGLGNQLFQYAIAKNLAIRLNTNLKLDIRSFKSNSLRKYELGNFNISQDFVLSKERFLFRLLNFIFRQLYKLNFSNRVFWYHEKPMDFDENVFKITNNTFLDGYWQNKVYFKSIENILKDEFTVKAHPDDCNKTVLKKIEESESVSIHIRRGDYVQDLTVNQEHGLCSLDYYYAAINLMAKELNNPYFFIFSDDIEWVKLNLNLKGYNHTFIDFNIGKSHEDLRLMYSCKHNIIANSSFSWWGAWLNKNPKKIVIGPKRWFMKKQQNNIMPDNWIKL